MDSFLADPPRDVRAPHDTDSSLAHANFLLARSFDSVKRDLIFEAWGTENLATRPRTLDEVKRHLMLEIWGVE